MIFIKKKKRLKKKTNPTNITFRKVWPLIFHDQKADRNSNNVLSIPRDLYFQEVPKTQELLTYPFKVTDKIIEYSNYNQLSSDQINTRNLYDCFHGILFYIYYYSENKLNINELEFHYSGGKRRESLHKITMKNPATTNYFDILNIFEYTSPNSQFKINSIQDAFFGVTFKTILVKPLAYSIRSGENQNTIPSLISFTFEGYDENAGKWDVLDERVNVNDLIKGGSYQMYYVRSIEKEYSSFKIRQLEPGNNGFWGFSIAALDIHGIITRKESYNLQNLDFMDTSSESYSTYNSYNPYMDMSDFI